MPPACPLANQAIDGTEQDALGRRRTQRSYAMRVQGTTIWRSDIDGASFVSFTANSRHAIFAPIAGEPFAVDTRTGRVADEPSLFEGLLGRGTFSSDGTRLALQTTSTNVDIVDVATERIVSHVAIRPEPLGFEFSPDGRTLLAHEFASDSGAFGLQLYDVATGYPIGRSFEIGGDSETLFPPIAPVTIDNREIVVLNANATVDHIRITPESWMDEACALAQRDLTDEEWRRFVGNQVPRDTTCTT